MEKVNFWLSVQCFCFLAITHTAKNIQNCWNLGAWKESTFGSVDIVFVSSISPPWQKIFKFAEILGHGMGQLLAQGTMFLFLHYHPHGQKYPYLLKFWGMERVNFWLSVQCFGVFTITPLAKNIQFCWNLGAWKGSTFGSGYYVFASSLLPPGPKISKLAEILGHGKGQL